MAAIVLLGEEPSARKLSGIALVVAGVLVLTTRD
jgi:multidrug transporter EmrE-like cation transporter